MVVILIDFEDRNENYVTFIKVIKEKFNSQRLEIPIEVASPNRMIENWYLADIAHLSKRKTFLRDNLRQRSYEGLHGKNELKRLFSKKYSYNETIHGPKMFAVIRFSVARKNSPSFHHFLNLTTG